MLSQTCHQLLETAARRYLTKSGFKNTADRDWRSFRDRDCELLLVWRCMGSFKLLSTIWFLGSQFTGDHQFHALTVFFHLLQGLGSMHQVYISLYQGPIKPALTLISCLESIAESGCESLHCLGGPYLRQKPPSNGQGIPCASNLRMLCINTPMLFTPSLRNTPLQRLVLTGLGWLQDDWTELFASLVLPQLTELQVTTECPIPTLIDFLLKNQIQNLCISLSICGMMAMSPRKLHPCPQALLHSLVEFMGPAEVIKNLSCLVKVSRPLQYLYIRLHVMNDHHFLLLNLLDCTEFAEVEEL